MLCRIGSARQLFLKFWKCLRDILSISFLKKLRPPIYKWQLENTCVRVSFLIKLQKYRLQACNFIKKEMVAQMFSCESCEIFKITFSYRTPLTAASADTNSDAEISKWFISKFISTLFLHSCFSITTKAATERRKQQDIFFKKENTSFVN